MKTKELIRRDWLKWVIIMAPFVLVILKWDSFPERIATHWNMQGEVNDYSDKMFALLLLPSINIMVYVLFGVLPLLDPKRKNYALFSDKLSAIQIILHLFLTYVTGITLLVALGHALNVLLLVQTGVIGFFLVFGNYIGNIRHNYFIGIRTPWTLANEQVWNLTHRLAAKIWVFVSLVMLPVCLLTRNSSWLFFIYIAILVLTPSIFSYVKFKELEGLKKGS